MTTVLRHPNHVNRYTEHDERFWSVKDLALANPSFGIAADFFPGMSEVSQFGHNPDVGTAFETLWLEGGLYVYANAEKIMTLSSSDTDDTSAGTGAQTVHIEGLDGNYNQVREDIALNGQNGVTLGRKYLRIHSITVLTAGSSLGNEGVVYVGTGSITTGKPAVVHGCVEIGHNKSIQGIYTIPLDHRGYLMEYEFGSSIAKTVTGVIVTRPFGEVFQVLDYRELRDGETSSLTTAVDVLEPKTDIELRAKTAAGGGDITAHMDIWLEHL